MPRLRSQAQLVTGARLGLSGLQAALPREARSDGRPEAGGAGSRWALMPCPSVSGAAVPGGGADACRPGAEVTGAAAEAAGAAAGGARDRRAGARAQHPHIPAEPGEAQGQEEEGQVQEKSIKAQRRPPNQSALRYGIVFVLLRGLVCQPSPAPRRRHREGVGDEILRRK